MEHFPTSAVNPCHDQSVFEEPTPAPVAPRDLRFSDWPMFNRVVEESPDICRRLLEVILDEPLEAVELVIGERAIEPRLGARGVRLDAFVRGSGRIYDVEMQAQSVEALGRRMRYYQASMDTGELRKGKEYVHLPDSFIVFICRNDHFGRRQPIYRFSMACEQDSKTHLEEGMHWLVLNA